MVTTSLTLLSCSSSIAPSPDGAAKLREGRFQIRQFSAAHRAIGGMLRFLRRGIANQAFGNLIPCQVMSEMLIHRPCSSPILTACTARNRWVLTVPSFIPVTAAISSRSMSSTNRRRKTVRCRSDRLAAALQMASTCSRGECDCLGRLVLVRDPIADVIYIHVGPQLTPPESEAVICLMIPNQVRGNVHQPRREAGASSKLITGFVSPHKAILGEVFRGFPIPKRRQKKPENPRPMLPDQRIEILESSGARPLGHRRRLGQKTSLHPHV